MLKKICVAFSVMICATLIFAANFVPVFANYADGYEIYLNDGSSLSEIVSIGKKDYFFIKNVKGESCKIDKEGFDVEEFFQEFDAVILFTETTDCGVSYYGYSPRVRYREMIKGYTVNLHVCISETQVTAGAPLIYGSF